MSSFRVGTSLHGQLKCFHRRPKNFTKRAWECGDLGSTYGDLITWFPVEAHGTIDHITINELRILSLHTLAAKYATKLLLFWAWAGLFWNFGVYLLITIYYVAYTSHTILWTNMDWTSTICRSITYWTELISMDFCCDVSFKQCTWDVCVKTIYTHLHTNYLRITFNISPSMAIYGTPYGKATSREDVYYPISSHYSYISACQHWFWRNDFR